MSRPRVRYLPVHLIWVLSSFACGGDSDPVFGPPIDIPPDPPRLVKASPEFGADIVEIFERRGCTLTGCHGTGASALTLGDTATSYANLVEVVSGCNGLVRVIPSNADDSYLVMKVEGTQPCGSRMPLNDQPLDSVDSRNIRNWVSQGALNN